MTQVSSDSAFNNQLRECVGKLLQELRKAPRQRTHKTLGSIGQAERQLVIAVLAELTRYEEPELRCDAVEALLRLDSTGTLNVVIPLLKDEDDGVRWWVSGLLHDFGDERATGPLIDVLQSDPAAHVRLVAAYALGRIGSTSALDALRRARDTDKGVHEGHRVSTVAADAIDELLSRA